ncbi:MAG: hypothetical protein AMXMBFR84_10610 [Candidatus Hydrogenedentota bacterium]
MPDKVIVTNWSAIQGKYNACARTIRDAVDELVVADAARGIQDRIIDLSDSASMAAVGATAVTNATHCKENKDAIDAVFRHYAPDYLLLLGSVDVIPHQNLENSIRDSDLVIWSDLPYACDAGYSKLVKDFAAPTRVVGRLPDLTKKSDAAGFVTTIRTAARWQIRDRADYEIPFALTAEDWKESTNTNLKAVFGNGQTALESPPDGPKWPAADLARRSHFVNCHGEADTPHFMGEGTSGRCRAHSAALLPGKITEGTVLAAECCYGAQLYDPQIRSGQEGICNTYLLHGAYGVMGSSTESYGSVKSNLSADLICQYFFKSVLKGASLGRALLEARQEFLKTTQPFGPVAEKTLAQFNLLGDPSIHPVQSAPVPPAGPPPPPGVWAPPTAEVKGRREELRATGLNILNTLARAYPTKAAWILDEFPELADIVQSMELGNTSLYEFRIDGPPHDPHANLSLNVLLGFAPPPRRRGVGGTGLLPAEPASVVIEALVDGKKIVTHEVYVSR